MSRPQHRRATAFDIRVIIAGLLAVYGAVTTVLGAAVTPDDEIARSAGVNINLWAGIGMLVVAAAFLTWALLRPIRVPPPSADEPADPH